MSDDDFLRRATQRLRDAGPPPPAEVAATRARVVDTLRKGERRRGRTILLLVPIAAVLVGTTALAKNGAALHQVWDRIASSVGLTSEPPPRQGAAPIPSVAPPVAAAEAPAMPEAPAPVEPVSAPVASEAPVVEAPRPSIGAAGAPRGRGIARGAGAPGTSTPPTTSTAAAAAAATNDGAGEDAEAASLALYKRAHRLHFVDRDYAAALDAWDDYVRAAPRGRLVIEARYNRAIALVHLGKKDDARASLTPFARGEIGGGYRQREAQSLLDALDADAH